MKIKFLLTSAILFLWTGLLLFFTSIGSLSFVSSIIIYSSILPLFYFCLHYLYMKQIQSFSKNISKKTVKFWFLLDQSLKLILKDERLSIYYNWMSIENILTSTFYKKISKDKLRDNLNEIISDSQIKVVKYGDCYLVIVLYNDPLQVHNTYRKIINHDLPSLFLSVNIRMNKIIPKKENELTNEIKDLKFFISKINLIFTGVLKIYQTNDVVYEKVNLYTIILDAIKFLEELYNKQNIFVSQNLINCDVNIDSNLLFVVVFNILKNAIDHNLDNEDLIIDIEKFNSTSKDYLNFYIQDNGKGIEEGYLRKFLYEGVKSPTSKGLGIGLSITHDIINLYQGKIEIENNNGLRVKISLPIYD